MRTLNRIFFELLVQRFLAPLIVSSLAILTFVAIMAGSGYQKQQETLNNSVSYAVSSYLYDAANVLDMLAIRASISDVEQVSLSMEAVLRGYEFFDTLYYLDTNGHTIAVSPPDSRMLGLDLSRQDYFLNVRPSGEAYISRPFISIKSGAPAVYISKAVPGRGVVAGELGLSELQRIIGLGTNLNDRVVTMITDRSGTLLAHPEVGLVAQQENISRMTILKKAQHGDLSMLYWDSGNLYTGSATLVQTSGWIVISQARIIDVFRPYLIPALLYVLVSFGVLTIFLRLFSGRFQQVVIEPLHRLSNATSEVAEGSFKSSEQIREPATFEELEHLTRNFNKMTESVLARETMLQHLATHDPLTNLPNRTMVKRQLEIMVRKAPAAQQPEVSNSLAAAQLPTKPRDGRAVAEARLGQDFAVLFIDLDDFKTVNDAFGHHTGDLVLQRIANMLTECIGNTGSVGRLGGDEFAVLLEQPRAVQNAGLIAEELLRRLTQSMLIDGHEIYLSASIGISVFPLDGRNPDELVQNADTAMYQAKEEGKNNYCYYSLEMETRAQERHRLTTFLHHALDQDEFEMVYQPIYETSSRRLVSSEALIRWHNPRMGMVPPARFIPLADETGLILPLGEWILNTSCKQNNSWQSLYRGQNGANGLRVSVNVSERQLRHKDFVATVRVTLDETHLPPELLTLELNENIFFQGFKEIGALLERVKQMGVRLALDDFGMGYATLSCLTQIPFDEIKIDRSLSQNITTSAADAAIVRGILHIAHDLGMQVVAEGVETEEQIRFYETLGCDLLQGYYFSKPLQVADFEAKIRAGQAVTPEENQVLKNESPGPD